MKKIATFVIVLCMVLSLCACGKVEITMQEIYDAGQTEALLKNHQSIYVREAMDGEAYREKYLTEEYGYDFVYAYDEEPEWVEFMTDDACYAYYDGDYIGFWAITPDGVNNDFSSDRAEQYASVILGVDTVCETIESVSKKDGRIALTSFLGQEALEDMAENGVTSGKFEYVLDAKTYEAISASSYYTFEDGTDFETLSEVSYDVEAPEIVKGFLEYANQTEDLRNITVVTMHGTEQEISQNIQVPKGLILGFSYDEAFDYMFELYSDADCTELYDPFEDTESDLSIYIKWNE